MEIINRSKNIYYLKSEDAKYLRLHLDRRLNWKHIYTKHKQLGLQLRKMYWLLGQ